MRIAGVHIEMSVLVIRDSKSGKVSSFNFNTIEDLFNSKEIKKCDSIYINAGRNNFIIKTKFFQDKNPEEAKNYVLKNLDEYTVGRSKNYIVKLAVVSKDNVSNVYIIEGKEKQIQKRISDLPIEEYNISGVIPDNFAISYPFMLKKGLNDRVLIVEVGSEEFILAYLEKRIITFTRSASFENEELVDSLKKEIDVLLHKIGSVDCIYFTGKLTKKDLKKLKKDFSACEKEVCKLYKLGDLHPDVILAYGLSLSPDMKFENDLTPAYTSVKRGEWKEEEKVKGFIRKAIYSLGILLSIPLILLIAGQIWLFTFNRQINKLSDLYEKNRKIQTEVIELREKLKLHEEARTPIPWGVFLFELSERIPDNVCLLELDSEPTINENEKGFIFNLTGEGKSQEYVMDFYSKIQEMDIVEETNIKKIKNEEGKTNFVFTVVLYSE